MLTTRVIPCLLLRNQGLVKTIKFKDPKYVGDPINAVKIFNEKEVDEIVFLDILASRENRKPNFDLIVNIASECFMPLCYGGGIRTIDDIKKIFSLGVEKVSINSYAIENPQFIKEASSLFGSQSIVVSIDVKKNWSGKYELYNARKRRIVKIDPVDYSRKMEGMGAGEILLNSVDRDGMMQGYNIDLIKNVCETVNIPVIACGGAGSIDDFSDAIRLGKAQAVAAGSMFVFKGRYRAVLISYPSHEELERVLP